MEQKITVGLEPALPLACFEAISDIPRASGKEEKIAKFLCDFAKERSLEYVCDKANNVYIVKDATKGMENKPAVSLQGHIDMVCEKESDCDHDFDNEGIKIYIDGDYIRAKGTTLGGDDGAAVACMMALLDSNDIPHPRLECVFTADEEVGMGGAKNFDFSLLTAKKMINIDSEEEGIVTVSCAGGARTQICIEFERVPLVNNLLDISVSGFAGGHSGGDIHMGKQNAAKVMGMLLDKLYEKEPFNLVSFSSGSKDNAIPRDAYATICVNDINSAKDFILGYDKILRNRINKADENFKIQVKKGKTDFDGMLTFKDTSRFLSAVVLCPNGVLSMSQTAKDFVESSTNLGIVATEKSTITMSFLSRSCDDDILDEIILRFSRLAKVIDADVSSSNRYPGWPMAKKSELCDSYCELYKEQTGKDAKVLAIHAGLECGLIKHEIPDLDVISIGPDIFDIHTPGEHLSISSFGRTWDLITKLIQK